MRSDETGSRTGEQKIRCSEIEMVSDLLTFQSSDRFSSGLSILRPRNIYRISNSFGMSPIG